MWGVVPNFPFTISLAASQKKTYFATLKMENALFVGRKKASMAFLSIARATRVSDMTSFRQTMP
jgi:hypothetical protein